MIGLEHLMPASHGGDDLVKIGGQEKGFGAFVVLIQEAIDGGLKVDERMEDAEIDKPGEKPVDGNEP